MTSPHAQTSTERAPGARATRRQASVRRVIGALVAVHGIAHVVGTEAFTAAADGRTLDYLGGAWAVSDPTLLRGLGALWALAAVAFLVVGLLVWTGHRRWPAALAGVAGASLLLTVAALWVAVIGVVVNLALLALARYPQHIDPAAATPHPPSRTGERIRPSLRRPPGRWTGAGIAVLAAIVWALIAAWWTPRGPITNVEGIATMGVSLLVGGAAGLATRSRWAMLLAPATFVAVFELARLGTDGPTVDGIHTSPYGLIALVTGRGIHGLLALAPMILGAAVGAGLARRRLGPPPARHGRARVGLYARRGVAALTAAGLIVLAVAVARPASTEPILGPDGSRLQGSVAELTRVEIGGRDLGMMIRGHSTENPVLLFLAGGPGGTELGAMRRHLEVLEEDFVVVTWDQRGTGKSYGQLDPASTLTLDRAVGDTLEVTEYLRRRFGQETIYLAGQSWGSTLGVLAAQRRPELYQAFVGIGQMVSQRETDRIFYADTLAWARETGDRGLVAELTEIGPPPYERMLDYEPALAYGHDVYPYDRSANSEGEGEFSENLFVEEYSLLEQVHNLGAFMDTFSVLYPQLQGIDFRDDAAELDVPVFLAQGRYEARGRAELADEWFNRLRAPTKEKVVFDTSGHRPLFEQPERFHEFMTETVLAQTGSGRPR